ncbi:WG repeat-containing protein [Mangrovimonas spongiae]|uniref:WG repeat-containing protein n=2 Tax=Mangrovimonas spongiae TaxID=2494697 RepID=A0A428K2V4_9FLAO|nr:WG repeat-containing protein [Mangrovimonas spongiae]
MKNTVILLLTTILSTAPIYSQSIENIDYISPVHENMIAIKKNNQWAFINTKGDLVINFRTDLVKTNTEHGNYPMFNSERCLIKSAKNGITYFGYIDKLGNTIIEPQFLNATTFKDGKAIVLKLQKEIVGRNDILEKNVVYHKYFEVVITPNGKDIHYINPDGTNVSLDKEFLRKPPEINSKRISNTLYAIKGENNKWIITQIENQTKN